MNSYETQQLYQKYVKHTICISNCQQKQTSQMHVLAWTIKRLASSNRNSLGNSLQRQYLLF